MLRRLLKKHALQRRIPVDQLPESQLPFPEVVRVLKAFSVGYPEQKIALNIRCKSGDASIRELRGSVVLPVSFLKTKTLVFATGDNAVRAKTAGADIVGGDELIPQILQNKLQFDRVIATPDMMSHVSKLARHLGPLGLMPTVKKGTVTEDVVNAIRQQADAVLFKADVDGCISAVIGKAAMKTSELESNIKELLREIKAVKKGKRTRFIEELTMQLRPLSESNDDSNALSDKLSSIGLSKAQFDL